MLLDNAFVLIDGNPKPKTFGKGYATRPPQSRYFLFWVTGGVHSFFSVSGTRGTGFASWTKTK